jgi:hypothetical protein
MNPSCEATERDSCGVRHPPQERDILPGRRISAVVIGAVLATIAGVLVAYAIGRCRARELGVDWIPPPPRPQIRSEVNAVETRPFALQAQGLEGNRTAEDWLSSYGWVDRERRIIHVPIEVAFDLYLARQQETSGDRPGDQR